MKIHGTAKGAALSRKDFGVAFSGVVVPTGCSSYTNSLGTGGNATVDGVTIDTSDQLYGDGCLSGDGSNDFVNCDGVVSSLQNTASSINFWFNKRVLGTEGYGLMFGDNNGTSDKLVVSIKQTQVKVSGDFAGVEHWEVSSPTPLPANTWHMITLTFDGSQVNFYYDGSSSGVTWINEDDRSQWINSNIDNCRIFCGNAGGSEDDFFGGLIQGVVFFNEAISSDTMAALYNSGAGAKISTLTDVCDTILCWYECDELSNSTLPNDAIPTS